MRAGILLLNQLLRRNDGDLAWALAGYNAGYTASRRARAGETALPPQTVEFVNRVGKQIGKPVLSLVTAQ